MTYFEYLKICSISLLLLIPFFALGAYASAKDKKWLAVLSAILLGGALSCPLITLFVFY